MFFKKQFSPMSLEEYQDVKKAIISIVKDQVENSMENNISEEMERLNVLSFYNSSQSLVELNFTYKVTVSKGAIEKERRMLKKLKENK